MTSPQQSFVGRPGNDACATIAGFVFQVNLTILHWLQLSEGEHLELEAGEDIDLVRQAADESEFEPERLFMQPKQHLPGGSLTLRSRDALESIANFCYHRRAYPDWKLRFRFITTLPVGKEQGWTVGASGIQTWEEIRLDHLSPEKTQTGLEAIRGFLQGCNRPNKFPVRSWNRLKWVLEAPDISEFLDVIRTFEWTTAQGNHRQAKEEVISVLKRSTVNGSAEVAEKIFDRLFTAVFSRLSEPGQKVLDADNLRAELSRVSEDEENLKSVRRLMTRLDQLEGRVTTLEATVQDQGTTIQAIVRDRAEESATAGRTFYSHDEFFRVPQRGQALYDFEQQLQGRRQIQEGLDQFLIDKSKLIAVLPGRGGIGKTKLLRDWSHRQDAWKVLWTAPGLAQWHPGTEREIPTEDTLIIVDDAHRYDELDRLLELALRHESGTLKLIISLRPSGNDYLKQALAAVMDGNIVTRFDPLKALRGQEVGALAAEVLGVNHQHFAERLAQVSHDTPLITVAGGRLIARGKIAPELLNNDEEFTTVVLGHLASQYEGQILTRGVLKQSFMEVVAALQPIPQNSPSFYQGVRTYLGLHESQARRSLATLDEGGVMLRRAGKAVIVPDLLADYLLERASLEPNGTLIGFPEDVFEAFGEDHLPNLIKNLAGLDWRITQRDNSSHLLDRIWSTVSARFLEQDAADRASFLRRMEAIARYQPERIHAIVQMAMDHEALPANHYGLFRMSHTDVLRRLPAFLGVTILSESVSRDAFDRLWELAHHPDDDVQRQSESVLKSSIGYHKYKDVEFNERILSYVEELALDSTAYTAKFTPFDLIDTLLDREMDDHGWVGRSFRVGALPVDPEYFRPVRERALVLISQALSSASSRVAVRAARSLEKAISEFRPRMRNGPTDEEQAWQDDERLKALGLLKARLESSDVSLPQAWKFHKILRSAEDSAGHSEKVKEEARRLIARLPQFQLFSLFHVLCTEEWEDCSPDGLVSDDRKRREAEAVATLTELYSIPSERVQALEDILQQATDAGIKISSSLRIPSALCEDEEFLRTLSRRLEANELPRLSGYSTVPIRAWRARGSTEFLFYGSAFARSSRQEMAVAAAAVAGSDFTYRDATSAEVEILSILTQRTEPWILVNLIHGLGALSRQAQWTEKAISLILEMEIGAYYGLAEAYCGIVGTGAMNVKAESLSPAAIETMLRKLVLVHELDGYHFGTFIYRVCGLAPLAVVELFEARLEHEQHVSSDNEGPVYQPVPSPSSSNWSSLTAIRNSPDYARSLQRLVALLQKYQNYSVNLDELFWRFGAADDTTLSVLGALLESEDECDQQVVIGLLYEGPVQVVFTHPQFVEQILDVCARRGEDLERKARQAFLANTTRIRGAFAAGGGPIQFHAGLSERAQAQLALCEPNGPAFRFYSELAGVGPIVFPGLEEELLGEDAE
jgi:hypothetical protein